MIPSKNSIPIEEKEPLEQSIAKLPLRLLTLQGSAFCVH